jgi:hypothetical protein
MKINIEMDNLQKVVEETASRTVENSIEETISKIILNFIEANFKQVIEDKVNNLMNEYIIKYINEAEITVGGGFDEPIKTYTPKEYINKLIKDIFDSQTFKIKVFSPYSGTVDKKVTFDELVKDEFAINETIKNKMVQYSKDLKKDIDKHIKETYDKALQETLSSTIVDIIMQDESFKHINNQIKRFS